MLAIKTSKLIDGKGRALEDMVVLVEGERIVDLGGAGEVAIPEGAELIDATNKTVMPGMVDAHLHVMGSGDPRERTWELPAIQESESTLVLKSHVNARRDLEAGFTAIRDTGCRAYVDVALRDAIDRHLVEGPRMKVAGQALASTGGHLDLTKGLAPGVSIGDLTNIVDSPDDGRKKARYQLKMGADFIKISATLTEYMRKRGGLFSQEMTLETMRAICEVAHWAGAKVAAHCHGGDGVRDAILAGVDSLEHGRFLADELLQMMAERGVYLVPTMSPEGRALEVGQEELGENDQDWSWTLKAAAAMYNTVERAHKMGVKIASGSDASMPFVRHGENAYELELLVRAGLTPMEAIVAATQVGSEVLDMANEIGTVERGKLADLLVIEGDPLTDIRILQDKTRIKKVIKGGRLVVERA